MTLDEKVGQMTQADLGSLKDHADVENYFLGSVLSGGDSDPTEGNSLEAWTNLYDRLQLHSAKSFRPARFAAPRGRECLERTRSRGDRRSGALQA